ncbi:MAG: hypothetical protein ACERKJ_03400 [Candidatus Dadabacteria bacterium]|jgi:hypothetical protein
MSKREIELEILQCDHEDENGERCPREGDSQAIKVCGICHKDLCITHYELTTATIQGTRDHFTYYFCPHHNDEFLNTLVDKFGDTRPIPRKGYGFRIN